MRIPARPADTDADAERVQVDLLRAAPVARRLHLALSLSSTVIGAARLADAYYIPVERLRSAAALGVAGLLGRALADAAS